MAYFFYLAVYTKADNRIVLLDKSEVLPILSAYWPPYDSSIHDYIVGMDEGAIDASYWDADAQLTDAALTAFGIDAAERLKYRNGLVIESDVGVPISYYIIDPDTGIMVYSEPALSARTMKLSAGFITGDPGVDLTGGPFGGPLVNASSQITVRVQKLYADGTPDTAAVDAVTVYTFGAASGIETYNLSAGVYDFTISLPAVTGYISLLFRSAEANVNYGALKFYRDAP